MRTLFLLLSLFLAASNAAAQTKVQRGIARMITRSAADPIVPVQGVEVVVGNVANKASDKRGRFTLNISVNNEQSYQVADVRLPQGSTLLLASPSKKKKLFLSKNDLEVALITPEDKNTVSKATYRKLLKKYNQQAEQLRLLRTQLEDQQLDLEESSSEYAQLTLRIDSIQALLNQYFDEKNRENTTKEIERIADELTLTDYQSLEEEDARIYDLMQEGDWTTLSAYLLELMNGDAATYVQEAVDQKNAATKVYNKASQELSRRLERIENAIESYKMQHLNDSVSRYYEILTTADSIDFNKLCKAGEFERDYMARYDHAISYFDKALKYAETDTMRSTSYNNIGLVYFYKGDYSKAMEYYNKELEILHTVWGEQHYDVATTYENLGTVCFSQGDYGKAEEYFQKALNIYLAIYGEQHKDVATAYGNLGQVYQVKQDFLLAEEYSKKALNILLSVSGELHPNVATMYNNLGTIYYSQSNYARAEASFQKALKIQLEVLGEQHPSTLGTYNNLGVVYDALGNYVLSGETYKKALDVLIVNYGKENPVAAVLYNSSFGFRKIAA